MNKQLLIIGKPHSSKTVFVTQFYIRLQKGKSRMKLYMPVADLTAITAAKDALAKGNEPEPTNAERSMNMILPIELNQQQFDLICPDYGGEQINKVFLSRQIDKNWAEAINASDNWIFFIRLNSINHQLDLSNIIITDHPSIEKNKESSYTTTEQSTLIELLQIFLHSKGYDYHKKNSRVKLTIVLTCWDELNTDKKPKDVLRETLPLLLNFIESNWSVKNLNFIGLSALEFALNDPINKEKYEIEGSENFGYMVNAEGQLTKDITELIAEAI